MGFDPESYEPVEARITKFWAEHPEGRITTTLIRYEEPLVIVRSEVYRDEVCPVTASGYAQETIGQGMVNKTSALENCETSAIGRALANLGYAAKARPSREEMVKASEGAGGTGAQGAAPSDLKSVGGEAPDAYGEGVTDAEPPTDAPTLDELIKVVGTRAKTRELINKTAGTNYSAATMSQATAFERQLALAAYSELVVAATDGGR